MQSRTPVFHVVKMLVQTGPETLEQETFIFEVFS